jgi:hypothetical protein
VSPRLKLRPPKNVMTEIFKVPFTALLSLRRSGRPIRSRSLFRLVLSLPCAGNGYFNQNAGCSLRQPVGMWYNGLVVARVYPKIHDSGPRKETDKDR